MAFVTPVHNAAHIRFERSRWLGSGVAVLGLADRGVVAGAALTAEHQPLARSLLAGEHPVTGETLVVGKVAVPTAAKVHAAALVGAVEAEAARLGVAAEELFTGSKTRAAFAAATRQADRGLIKVTDAERLARSAGLTPGRIWAPTALAAARAALFATAPDGTRVERRESVRVPAFDLVLDVPEVPAPGFAEALESAAARVIGWLEGRVGYVRIGTEGRGRQASFTPSAGMIAWARTDRAGRQRRAHVTILNLAKAPDGRWRGIAAGGRDLVRHARAAEAITRCLVRAGLTPGPTDFDEHAVAAALTGRFDHLRVLTEVADALTTGGTPETVEHLAARVLADPAFVEVAGAGLRGAGRMPGGRTFTTVARPA